MKHTHTLQIKQINATSKIRKHRVREEKKKLTTRYMHERKQNIYSEPHTCLRSHLQQRCHAIIIYCVHHAQYNAHKRTIHMYVVRAYVSACVNNATEARTTSARTRGEIEMMNTWAQS